MNAIEILIHTATAFGIVAVAIGGYLLLAIGVSVARWWIANHHRLGGGDMEIIMVATREEMLRMIEEAGPAGMPVIVGGACVGVMVARDGPGGRRVAVLWACGIAGCAGHETREGATLHRETGGFAGDLERWARAQDGAEVGR